MKLFLYLNIIESKHVGGDMVPLLKRMTYDGIDGQIQIRSFPHLQYIDVAAVEIPYIWMYMKTECGIPPPISKGNFSATLHFRRKRY